MAIKINTDTVISDSKEFTGAALTVGTVQFPTAIGTEGQVLTVQSGVLAFDDAAEIPPASQLKGALDVSQAGDAPGAPAAGDIYIQHASDNLDKVADVAFNGIAGATVKEGQYIIYGANNRWYLGSDSTELNNYYDKTEINTLLGDKLEAGDLPDPQDLQSVTTQGKDTTTGITIATDKIVLNASGTATFAGNVDFGTDAAPVAGNNSAKMVCDHNTAALGALTVQNKGSGSQIVARDPAGYDRFRIENDGGVYSYKNGIFEGHIKATLGYKLDHLPALEDA